jgi:hypothetical protein
MTDTPDQDIIARLHALAVAAEVSAGTLDRKRVAALARDAADEISRLRRKVEGLQARLDGLRDEERC